MREVLRLVTQGVPWADAWDMGDGERLGYLIGLGEMRGGEWDHEGRRWTTAPNWNSTVTIGTG